jgi:RHS repeat-associated protein
MKLLPKLAWLTILIAASPIAAADFNLSPNCSAARASTESLWPPKHTMAPINIMGVTDPNGDMVDITIACISQDEPLDHRGDGNTEPDASGIGASTALVRQERSGNGNGRFYHIDFIATDSQGARCGGEVTVQVAKSTPQPAVDDGRLYKSVPTENLCGQHDINNSPIIYTKPELNAKTETTYNYQVQAHDPDQDALTYRLTAAPQGMVIDSNTGLIEWSIGPSQAGEQTVEVVADDGRGGKDTQQFIIDVIHINKPPVIITTPEITGYEATPYVYDVDATDENVDDVLTHSFDLSPSGFVIDPATGEISWTPIAEYVGAVSETNDQCHVVPVGSVSTVEDGEVAPGGEIAVMSPLFRRVTEALEISADFSARESIEWDRKNGCLGCHIQTQSLVGLETSIGKADIDEGAVDYLLNSLFDNQQANGTIVSVEHKTIHLNNQTSLALWALSSHPDRTLTFSARAKALNFFVSRYQGDASVAYWNSDHNTGWMNNAFSVTALVSMAGARILDDRFNSTIEFSESEHATADGFQVLIPQLTEFFLSGHEQPVAKVTQTAFRLIGLSELKHFIHDPNTAARVENAIDFLDQYLRSIELDAGGWAYQTGDAQASPVASAWVGIALNYLNPDLSDPVIIRNIEYLLSVQNLAPGESYGTWRDASIFPGPDLAATSLVMSYLPVALDFLGNPDLNIARVSLSEEGEGLRVHATISNRGMKESSAQSTVNFYAGVDPGGELLGSVLVPGTQSGTSVDASILVEDPILIGTDIYAEVIAGAGIEECEIRNNTRRAPVVRHRVTDQHGLFDTQIYSLNIEDVNAAPVITSATTFTHQQAQLKSLKVEVADEDIGDAATFSLVAEPVGVSIDPRTGQVWVDGALMEPGSYTFTVHVEDLRGASVEQQITFTVVENFPPVIVSEPVTQVLEGKSYFYDVEAVDPNSDELQFSSIHSGLNFAINNITGALSGLQDAPLETLREHNDFCEGKPVLSDDLAPTVKWAWTAVNAPQPAYKQVMQTPIVIPLYDTNGDGKIDALDEKAVIFMTFASNRYWAPGFLRAISAKTGEHLWTAEGVNAVLPEGSLAAADINGDGSPEIIAPLYGGGIVAVDNNGNQIWRSEVKSRVRWGGASIHDLDSNGVPEIIVGNTIFDNTGKLKFQGVGPIGESASTGPLSFAADVNLDGKPEIIAGGAIYDSEANLLANNGEGFAAVGNFDGDDFAEITVVHAGTVSLYSHDGSPIWTGRPIPGGGRGGAPVVADMTGNGVPEIGVAGASFYVVFDAAGNMLWSSPVVDTSSHATGSSVFDFNGDGRSEVVYADQHYLRVYDGPTGNVLYQVPNSSGTTYEYPLIVDVDDDGHAEIIVIGNNYAFSGFAGIRAFEDINNQWVATRSIWNQHAYSISNINDDLSVPITPEHSWLTHNTFRLNTFEDRTALAQPDLAAFNLGYDENIATLSATVLNRGMAPTNAHAAVTFYNGDPDDRGISLGSVNVGNLQPGQEQVAFLANITADMLADEVVVTLGYNGLEECDVDNNKSAAQVVTVSATDEGGLSDTQTYLLSVTNQNDFPTIVIPASSTIIAGDAFELRIEVEDPDVGDAHRFSLTDAPEGVAINDKTGIVTADVGAFAPGVYSFNVVVQDLSGAEAEQVQVVTVTQPDNLSPEFSSVPPVSIATFNELLYTAVASDPDGDEVVYLLSESPSGAVIDGVTGEIRWTPTQAQAGYQIFDVTAMDTRGATASQRFAVEVIDPYADNRPPEITSQPSGMAVAGALFEYQLTATDSEGDELTYSLKSPSGNMAISDRGLFTWLPDAASIGRIFTVDVQVTDVHGAYDMQTLALPVNEAANTPPRIISTPLGASFVGEEYLYQLAAVDADGDPISFQFGPQKPNGMVMDSGGLIRWTPDTGQSGEVLDVEVMAIDGRGAASIQYFSVAVNPVIEPNEIPYFVSAPTSPAIIGEEYTYQAQAQDVDMDLLVFELTSADIDGLSVSGSGLLSWTPVAGQEGEYPIAISVSDGKSIATQSYTLHVTVPGGDAAVSNTPPSISSTPGVSAAVDELYQYQVLANDADGDSVTYLLNVAPTGMQIDDSGLLTWTPDESHADQTVPVELRAQDDRGGYSTQSFNVLVNIPSEPNQLPFIESSPPSPAIAGELYEYQVVGVDLDFDPLTYMLVDTAIAGLNLSAAGQLTWTPTQSQLGDHSITIKVSDGKAAATQSYLLKVQEPDDLTNAYPMVNSSPETEVVVNQLYAYQLLASDPDGDALTFELLSELRDGMTFSSDGLLQWVPGIEDVGIAEFIVKVSDGQLARTQIWSVKVWESVPPLRVFLDVSSTTVNEADQVAFSVATSGGSGNVTARLFVDGVELPLDDLGNASIFAAGFGLHDVRALATSDSDSAEEIDHYLVRNPDDMIAPIAAISSPNDSQVITEPVPIIGTATDDNLVAYHLYISSAGKDDWRLFDSGNTNVNASELAVLDPTMMVNGQYSIHLQVTDVNGQQASDTRVVVIDGDLKVGNFSFTVQDLNVPMVGIPIQVSRTYDSRRRFEDLDFGYGWSIDYQNVKLEESRIPGKFWAINEYKRGPYNIISDFCIEPMGAPVVTITLPNDEVERFEVAASPRCSTYQVIKDVTLDFQPLGDNQSTLIALDQADARYESGTLLSTSDFTSPVDPSRYKLTTQAGYEYILNQSFGVEKIVDPNGHTLTYTDDGIFHSSGKAVTFERNSQGRITDVIAPDGKRLTYHYDAREDLEHVIDRDNSTTHYTYNSAHGLVDIIDPLNRPVLKNLYDDDGRLYAQEDGNGYIKYFDHNLSGKTSLVTDRDGRSTLLEYDAEGLVQSETLLISDGSYAQDIVTAYSYDANGNQETRTIGNSTWNASFDARNNQLFAEDPEGHTVHYRAYNARGQEEKIEDEMGRVSEMEYDTVGNLYLIKLPPVIDPDTGETTTPTAGNIINAKGQITETTDVSGLKTTYTYYPDGHAWEGQKHTESNAISGTVTFTYDDNNNVKTETRERTLAGTVAGAVVEETTTYEYDARDRVTKTIFPDGSYTETVYDLAGNTDKERDRFGHWTDYTYDAYGRLTHTDYPDGTTEVRTYTDEGLLETVTDRSGYVTRNEYDDAGRLWKVHNEQDSTFTETRYTVQGWVQYEWDEKRNRTEHRYDKAGRRTHTVRVDDAGRELIWSFGYYPNGELHTETDPLGHTTEYILNALDQRVETRYHNGTVQEARYDLMGRRIATIDQKQRRTAFDFDALGRLEGVTPKVSIDGEAVPMTAYTYDEVGNKLTQTDANGHTTRWTYDTFGRVTSRTLPEGMTETFEYLDAQNIVIHTDFNGDTITTTRDAMGQVETVLYSKDGVLESYTYWPNDQIKTATTPAGQTQYFYDHRHRLDYELRPDGTRMDYDYDAVGNRTLVKVTRNGETTSQTSYTYDALNRLDTATNDLTPSEVTEYTYDAAGNLDTVTYPNGLVTDYAYNSVNQLTDVYTRDGTGTLISHYAYTLDDTGRRTVISELDGRTTAYCHDELYRLSAETVFEQAASPITEGCLTATDRAGASYTADYTYDWVGNRTYETVDGVQTQYTCDTNDRLEETGGTVYGYDDNGNTISETLDGETTIYHYNGKNQLISVDKAGGTTSYTYNPNGIRNSKTENGTTTRFIVDENRDYAQVLEEVVDGNKAVGYSYGHDLISQDRSGASSFYHYDGLGSTRALSDADSSLTDIWNYDAFGGVLNRTGDTENSYLFAGEQFDQSLNQYYLRARYYDQNIGRFTQQDTWMGRNHDPVTLHKYLYANVDPVNGIDPSGNMTMVDVAFAGAVAGVLTVGAYSAYQVGQDIAGTWESGQAFTPGQTGWLVLVAMVGVSSPLLDNLVLNVDSSNTISGQDARSKVEATASFIPVDGQVVYRVWGGCSGEFGASWTPLDPRLGGMGYRNLAGLPTCNAGTFMSQGILRTASGITVFPGLELDGNIGGWPEYVIPNSAGQVNVIARFFVEPPF